MGGTRPHVEGKVDRWYLPEVGMFMLPLFPPQLSVSRYIRPPLTFIHFLIAVASTLSLQERYTVTKLKFMVLASYEIEIVQDFVDFFADISF